MTDIFGNRVSVGDVVLICNPISHYSVQLDYALVKQLFQDRVMGMIFTEPDPLGLDKYSTEPQLRTLPSHIVLVMKSNDPPNTESLERFLLALRMRGIK